MKIIQSVTKLSLKSLTLCKSILLDIALKRKSRACIYFPIPLIKKTYFEIKLLCNFFQSVLCESFFLRVFGKF